MELQNVIDAATRAREIHEAMRAITSTPPSIDALFLCAYLELAQPSAKRTYSMRPTEAPQWFIEAVERMPNEPRTAGDFLRATNNRAEKSDCKLAGSWLRKMGFASRKSNGRVYFERSYPPTLPASLPASLAK